VILAVDNGWQLKLWAQSDAEIVERVEAALRVRAQADAVLLAAIGEVEARGLARARGASSTRAWLHGAHQLDPAEASMLVRTGTSLRAGFQETGLAIAAGEVSLSQARVVIRSVTDLPDNLDPGLGAAAETLMVGHCAVFDPMTLALIGRRLAECIHPEGTQARDEKKHLEREKTPHAKRSLTISPDKDGPGRYPRGYLDPEGGVELGRRQFAVRSAALHRRDQTPDHHHHSAQLTAERDRRRTTQ